MEGRSLWIQDGDVDGTVEEGRVVTATRPLSDFCLRGDDGGEPVAAGSLLEVIEVRPWGAAMAQELSDLHSMDGMMVGDADANMAQVQAEVDELLGVTDAWEHEFIEEAQRELPPNDDTEPCSIDGCDADRAITFDDGTGACRACIRKAFLLEAAS